MFEGFLKNSEYLVKVTKNGLFLWETRPVMHSQPGSKQEQTGIKASAIRSLLPKRESPFLLEPCSDVLIHEPSRSSWGTRVCQQHKFTPISIFSISLRCMTTRIRGRKPNHEIHPSANI